jgi:uncharacterized caspase-like protein
LPLTVGLHWRVNYQFQRDLYLLCVGVSDYPKLDEKKQLKDAVADANDLYEAFNKQVGPNGLYRKRLPGSARLTTSGPAVDVLKSAHLPTNQNIVNALEELRQQVTSPETLVIVTFSGHGTTDDSGHFFFLPADYDPEARSLSGADSKALAWDTIMRLMAGLPCPVIVIVDACHAGATKLPYDQAELEQELERGRKKLSAGQKGMVILAACRTGESAAESKEWGHGALSLAVLEVLEAVGRRRGEKPLPSRGKLKKETPIPEFRGGKRKVVVMEDVGVYSGGDEPTGHRKGRVNELASDGQTVVILSTDDIILKHTPIAIGPPPEK